MKQCIAQTAIALPKTVSMGNDHTQKLNVYMYIYVEDRLFLQNFNAISIIEEEVQTYCSSGHPPTPLDENRPKLLDGR